MKYKTTAKAIREGSMNPRCTGYRGMPGKRLEGIAEAENKARALLSWENNGMTYDEKREAVEELLHEFCKANGGY